MGASIWADALSSLEGDIVEILRLGRVGLLAGARAYGNRNGLCRGRISRTGAISN